MKNLVICCDGTWNTPEQEENNIPAPTNVVRLFNCVAIADGEAPDQKTYYHPGVGTEGGFLARAAGGMYGDGLSKNIKSAYAWLCHHYTPGDRIFLFGFSRGAFTVRSLGGLLGRCGLLSLADLEPEKAWARVDAAYDRGYRKRAARWTRANWEFLEAAPAPIHFVGVWDTVGALGIPDDLPLLNLLDRPENWRFHDTTLGDNVRFARHAIAIDELRASFTPTLWTKPGTNEAMDNDERVKQVWFSGVHSNVGGGYAQSSLSDIALQWMIEEARAAGLRFQDTVVAQIRPDHLGVLHDSARGIFKSLRSRPRAMPHLSDPDRVHDSVRKRSACPPITQSPYHPTIAIEANTPCTVSIYAREPWNRTGLFLDAGHTYEFSASGQWLDKNVPCGPDGTKDGKFHLGEIAHVAASAFGKVESLFQKVTDNTQADFWGTKRAEAFPWFALVGVIANDGLNDEKAAANDGSPSPHQSFLIGSGPTRLTVSKSGYLYAYANDAWHFYDNNRGSVELTVKRAD